MPVLHIQVENPDELLNASYLGAGALGRVERSATGGGAGYSEIGTFAIVAATRAYTYYDLAGGATSWYRLRYSKSDGSSPSSYGDEFQAGDEEGGLICSTYDVEQLLFGTSTPPNGAKEDILDLIRAVTDEFESVTGRDFTGYHTDVTFRVHTRYGRSLWFPKGLQSITTLGIATQDQPSSGGTYTTVTDWYLDPPDFERDPFWPAVWIRFPSTSGNVFYDASFGAEITGKPGWARVPPRISRIGANVVASKYLTGGKAGPRAVIGPEGQTTILRDISPADYATLMEYAVPRVA